MLSCRYITLLCHTSMCFIADIFYNEKYFNHLTCITIKFRILVCNVSYNEANLYLC